MVQAMRDPASKFFNCTDRERAIFEAGIKLGTIYHQYVGAPLNLSNVESLEKAIEESAMVQPFVEEAHVKIDKEIISKKQGVYKYITLAGEMLNVTIVIKYNDENITARLRYVPEIDYPLMYVEG
jgi:hypothetical protein